MLLLLGEEEGGEAWSGEEAESYSQTWGQPAGVPGPPTPTPAETREGVTVHFEFFPFFCKKKVFEQGGEKGFSKYFFENPAIFALKKIIF